jgi:hypothetical protein
MCFHYNSGDNNTILILALDRAAVEAFDVVTGALAFSFPSIRRTFYSVTMDSLTNTLIAVGASEFDFFARSTEDVNVLKEFDLQEGEILSTSLPYSTTGMQLLCTPPLTILM